MVVEMAGMGFEPRTETLRARLYCCGVLIQTLGKGDSSLREGQDRVWDHKGLYNLVEEIRRQ